MLKFFSKPIDESPVKVWLFRPVNYCTYTKPSHTDCSLKNEADDIIFVVHMYVLHSSSHMYTAEISRS